MFIFASAESAADVGDVTDSDRVIFLSEVNAESRNGTNMNKHSLTTVFYPNDQIGAYQNFEPLKYRSTTPMNVVAHDPSTVAHPDDGPPNHRKRFAEVLADGERSTREGEVALDFQVPPSNDNHSTSRVVFPDSTRSDRHVNSIRDILDHVDEDDSAFPSPSSRGRGVRIAGTYRRYRKYDMLSDPFVTMQSTVNVQTVPTSATNAGYGTRKRPKDPFSEFKPTSVSDVNLLATNQVRFAPYRHNKPRPLLQSPAGDAKPKPSDYANQNLVEAMYNQILWANNNRMKTTAEPMNSRNEYVPKKQKPFSLMLDVYPMPSGDDDLTPVSSTRYTPHANRQPVHPIYAMPIDVHAINHNLQYASDNLHYTQMKFPQLQSYHRKPNDGPSSNAAPYTNGPPSNYYYYRNYMPKRLNVYPSNQYRRPSPPVYDVQPSPSTDDAPSQITVHLNLFPNKKKAKSSTTSRMRNIQVLDWNTDDTDDTDTDDDDDTRFYKRRMEYENVTDSARISTPHVSSSSVWHDTDDGLSPGPLKSPTIAPHWMRPHFDKDVYLTNTSFVKTIAEDTSASHLTGSMGLDATTNYDENIHSTNTAKPIFGNRSMATASDQHQYRSHQPESTQSDTFSKSSSIPAQRAASDDINRTAILSTQSTNGVRVSTPTPRHPMPTLAADNDQITHQIKFPQD